MKVQNRVDSLKQVRKMDFIPGVLYGQTQGPVNIQVGKKEFLKALAANGQTAVFPCEIEGAKHKVYIRDLQREIIRRDRFQHFSLQIVSGKDKIRAMVQIHLENKGIVEGKGLVINHVLHEIDVKYGLNDTLEDILIDVANMGAGDSMLLSDVELPSYLEVLTSMDVQVVSVIAPRAQADEVEIDDVPEVVPA